MINITMVNGDVLVEDRKNCSTQMARTGMKLATPGNYLIATTPTSRADIMLDGQLVKLPPGSFLRVLPDQRTRWESHKEAWTGDAKLYLGKIWARLARDSRDPYAGRNAVVGVRG